MVVPRGFEGLVINTPFTFRLNFRARSYASCIAEGVILKPFELVHCIGTISAPVRHLRSLSNLYVPIKFHEYFITKIQAIHDMHHDKVDIRTLGSMEWEGGWLRRDRQDKT